MMVVNERILSWAPGTCILFYPIQKIETVHIHMEWTIYIYSLTSVKIWSKEI